MAWHHDGLGSVPASAVVLTVAVGSTISWRAADGTARRTVRPHITMRLSTELRREFGRVPPRPGHPTHDLETRDGKFPRIALEAKELVPGEFLKVKQAVAADRGLDSTILVKRWTILIEEEPLSGPLAPMPTFPEDSSAEGAAACTPYGMILRSKAEREREWR